MCLGPLAAWLCALLFFCLVVCLALLQQLCLAVCLTVQLETPGCVPCCPVYLAGCPALLLRLAVCITLQLETLGCVWLLPETLVTFGCVPDSFAEMLFAEW